MVGLPGKDGGAATDVAFRRMESGGDTRSLLDFALPKRLLLEESLLIISVRGDAPPLNCIQKDVENSKQKRRKMRIALES
jgi:hypothetical protein